MSGRILVIDDDPDTLALVRGFLDVAGFEVETAAGGEAGLAAARADPPDLVLLDVIMPGMSGMEVFERLKEEPETKEIPVIFVTAVEEEPFKNAALALGVDRYIMKPFEALDLMAKIHSALGQPLN